MAAERSSGSAAAAPAAYQAHRLFFAAATIQATLSVGIWMFARPDAADGAGWHAHELLFGYVTAVIAGFLFTKSSRRTVFVVFALWALARLAWLVPLELPAVRALLSIAATAAIGVISARGFMRGAKRVQNIVFPILLALVAGCDLLSQLPAFAGPDVTKPAILGAVYAVSALIAVMGGRIAGAAFSGLNQRAGGPRIVPRLRLEGVFPFLMVGTVLALTLEWPLPILALCSGLAALILLVRLLDWLPAMRYAGPELLALAAAQAFLAAGFAGTAMQLLEPPWSIVAPLHLLTIGGIGIATVTMMLKAAAQRERLPPADRTIAAMALLMGLAAILRAGGEDIGEYAYAASALAWCAAMLCCLFRLLKR